MLAGFFENVPLMIMLTGALVGISASLLGTFLVLRGSSMLSDAISHSIVLGIVLVWLITRQQSGPVQIAGAALAGMLTVILTEVLTRTQLVKNDAAIGLVFPMLFSIGVLLLNLYARDIHIDQHTVLLGEIAFVWLDTVEIGSLRIPQSVISMAAMTLVNLVFVSLLFKELKVATFDPILAKMLGFAPGALFYALLLLTSATAVAAFDAVGVVLFIAFVIVPPSAAYLLTDRLVLILLFGAAISVASSGGGYYLANAWNVSIGGMMASMTGVFLLAALLFGTRYGLIAKEVRRRNLAQAHECRTLAVHLLTHEGTARQNQENAEVALCEHLGWPSAKAERILHRCVKQGLLVRRTGELRLTVKGRAYAREVIEPWRAGSTTDTHQAQFVEHARQ